LARFGRLGIRSLLWYIEITATTTRGGTMAAKKYILAISFHSEEDLIDWAKENLDPEKIGVFKADALDPEFGGRANDRTHVLRRAGATRVAPRIA
jgi:hypothetical protein